MISFLLVGCTCGRVGFTDSKTNETDMIQETGAADTYKDNNTETEQIQEYDSLNINDTVFPEEYTDLEQEIDMPVQISDEETLFEDEETPSTTEDPFLYEGELYEFPEE